MMLPDTAALSLCVSFTRHYLVFHSPRDAMEIRPAWFSEGLAMVISEYRTFAREWMEDMQI
ncbi:MAG TPA: hypothetical protein PLV45_16485 [bacterium]|nr:hypothetical protein [bacterium]